MKLTNEQIWRVNLILGKVSNNELSGKLAFKLFRIKKQLEEVVIIIQNSLKGKENEDKEVEEVMELENDIDVDKIKASELEELNLSIQDVFCLECIIDFEEEVDE